MTKFSFSFQQKDYQRPAKELHYVYMMTFDILLVTPKIEPTPEMPTPPHPLRRRTDCARKMKANLHQTFKEKGTTG